VLGCEPDEVADVVTAELAVEVVDVRLHRLPRDAVLARRLDDAPPRGDELKDLALAHRQALERVGRPPERPAAIDEGREGRRDVTLAPRDGLQRRPQGLERLRLHDVG